MMLYSVPPASTVRAKKGLLQSNCSAGQKEGGCILRDDGQMGESQLVELQNMRVLLEEARVLARHLAYHRRARLEGVLGRALEEVDLQIEELRSEGRR
jgi:hypothetical protein